MVVIRAEACMFDDGACGVRGWCMQKQGLLNWTMDLNKRMNYYNNYNIRPHKVDLQIIVTIFPIFQAGGRSLFIIHWPISFIKASHAPQ